MDFSPYQTYRSASGRPVGAFAAVMLIATAVGIFGDADEEGIAGATQDVTEIHGWVWVPLGSPRRNSSGLARDKIFRTGKLWRRGESN